MKKGLRPTNYRRIYPSVQCWNRRPDEEGITCRQHDSPNKSGNGPGLGNGRPDEEGIKTGFIPHVHRSEANQGFLRFGEFFCCCVLVGTSLHDDGRQDHDALLTLPNEPAHLMTALRAKGKEFDAVFILDANRQICPSRLAVTDAQLEWIKRCVSEVLP